MPFDSMQALCPEGLRLVMFDLDGTLVDSLPDLHAATGAMLQALQKPPVSLNEVELWIGNGARRLVARALSRSRNVDPELSETDIEEALDLFKEQYRLHNGQKSRCYQGAKDLLKDLSNAGIHRAIVTNKPYEFARELCNQLALSADLLLGGDSLAEMKPSPLPLRHCLQHFGVPTGSALMVGDSINDLEAARAAGVTAIAVSHGYNHGMSIRAEDAACVIDSLEELR